jgi:hypothetical protein
MLALAVVVSCFRQQGGYRPDIRKAVDPEDSKWKSKKFTLIYEPIAQPQRFEMAHSNLLDVRGVRIIAANSVAVEFENV